MHLIHSKSSSSQFQTDTLLVTLADFLYYYNESLKPERSRSKVYFTFVSAFPKALLYIYVTSKSFFKWINISSILTTNFFKSNKHACNNKKYQYKCQKSSFHVYHLPSSVFPIPNVILDWFISHI